MRLRACLSLRRTLGVSNPMKKRHPTHEIETHVVAGHLLVAWLLLLICLTLLFAPAYFAIQHLVPKFTVSPDGALAFIAITLVSLMTVAALIYGALHLFLRTWFSYLSILSPSVVRAVEHRLPSVLNVPALQPQYSRVRSRFTRLPK